MHTIKDGQFVRTLIPIDCTGPSINITFIALSYQGKFATDLEPSNWFKYYVVCESIAEK